MRRAFIEIEKRYERALQEYPPFNSAHEGYAIIAEEFEEFWDEIKRKGNDRDWRAVTEEAAQLGAMAMRFLIDICRVEVERGE